MKKMAKIFVGLSFVFSLALLSTGAFAQVYSDQFPPAQAGRLPALANWNTFEASWFMKHEVVTPWTDDYLGQISGLVIDRTNNRIAAVVLSDLPNSGGSWYGNMHLVLPYASVARDIGQSKVVFNPGDMRIGPALEPNWPIGTDPWVYALITAGNPGLYTIPATMDVAWLTDVYRAYGQVPYWEIPGEPEPNLVLLDSNRLVGAQVQLATGEITGRINDLVISAPDGRVVFVVLSDLPGRPETYVAVPFVSLTTRGDVYVLNISREKLATSMVFSEENLNNPIWASNLYTYFGVAPYWTMPAAPAPEEGTVNFNVEINK